MFKRGFLSREPAAPEMGKRARFEAVVIPHLGAAYNLARWLTRNDHDAEDVTQEAYLRALKFFDGFRGGDGRAWLLAIVRNTCFTWLKRNHPKEIQSTIDDQVETLESDVSPEAELIQKADAQVIRRALEDLPAEYREVIVLREMEELSYKEIAELIDIPLGTVMSRLARARKRLQEAVIQDTTEAAR
jgi:RNA polymerase sigma-70 factor (ECF subfamily)